MNSRPLIVGLTTDQLCAALTDALAERVRGQLIIVSAEQHLDDTVIDALVRASSAPLAASVSPLSLQAAPSVRSIPPTGLPPATVAAPDPRLVLLVPDAIESIAHRFDPENRWEEELRRWADVARHHGWRHTVCPSVVAPVMVAALVTELDAAMNGPANELLSTLVLRAETHLRPVAVVVDGACMQPGAEATGTFQVVTELTRELARARPEAVVSLAVPAQSVSTVAARMAGASNVRVVERDDAHRYDVVYRPYQFLRPEEIPWTFSQGARTVLGQLDMIGFSNDAYHPRLDMFLAARNMQRATMRRADGVITISRFAAESIIAECPDLEPRRLAVVPCGTDHVSPDDPRRPEGVSRNVTNFIVCLSATFWHKNRLQAVRTFAELRRRGYTGHLIIAGPEPFFGRSTDAEDDELGRLPPEIATAVHRLGAVDEAGKWWLLTEADVVLYPSINEGFGLVPFEAATAGTPALSGRAAALPEILGPDVRIADTWQPGGWADIIEGWMRDPQDRSAQVQAIRRRGSELTWRHAAELTWDHIDGVIELPRRMPPGHEGDRWAQMERHELGLTPPGRAVRQVRRIAAYVKRRVPDVTSRWSSDPR